jgi:hypothetical protein
MFSGLPLHVTTVVQQIATHTCAGSTFRRFIAQRCYGITFGGVRVPRKMDCEWEGQIRIIRRNATLIYKRQCRLKVADAERFSTGAERFSTDSLFPMQKKHAPLYFMKI